MNKIVFNRQPCQWLSALLLLLTALGVTAESYQVTLKVDTEKEKERNTAALKAFKEVLIRSSGTEQVLTAFYVRESYKKVFSFIKTYQYKKSNPLNSDERIPELSLEFQFNEKAIDDLVKDSGVAMWGGRKPVTLFWIAYEHNKNRQLLNASDDTENDKTITSLNNQEPLLFTVFNQEIQRRGLPYLLPLMDLRDRNQIEISDVWGRFPEPILKASQRYASEANVAGRMILDRDIWRGSFMLNVKEQIIYQTFEAPDKQMLMKQLIDWVGEQLCQAYCVYQTQTDIGESNQKQMLVTGVGNFTQYRQVIDYFEELSAIRNVEIAEVSGRQLLVNLELVGDLDSLIQAIALDHKLIEIDQNTTDILNTHSDLLMYQWRP